MSELCDYKDVSHSFDDEDHISLHHLYKSFCNHVTLGQWELARVCLRGLYERRHDLENPLKEIVRAVIDQPTSASSGSPSVISPLHLSWLCLVEYLELFTSYEDKLPAPIAQTVEFRLLLYLTCKTAPKQLIQELHDYYCKIVYGDTSSFKDDISILSTSALQFLQNLLDEDPAFGHALISQLTSHTKYFLENNHNLEQLYTTCINKCLDTLESHGSSMKRVGSISSLGSLEQPDNIEETKKHLYQLLSFMNPTPDMISLSDDLDSLFERFIQHSKTPGLMCLDLGTLYSCLLQRPTTFLIQKFCQVENKMRLSYADEMKTFTGQQRFGVRSPVYFPAVRVCLFQTHVAERTEAWQHLFFHALNQNHVLENIVETALLLIKDGDFSKVTQLLNPPEFRMLKPLVLLLGWPYCYSCENARNLLDALWDPKAQMTHHLLYQACQKLAYQVQLVQWCLEKAGLLLASSEAGSTNHQQASEMFQGLESHSVLRVLHKSISLAQLPEKEVFALLRKRPVFSPGSEHTCTPVDEETDGSHSNEYTEHTCTPVDEETDGSHSKEYTEHTCTPVDEETDGSHSKEYTEHTCTPVDKETDGSHSNEYTEHTCTPVDGETDGSHSKECTENRSKTSDFSFIPHEEHKDSKCIHPEVERDLILYHSFCATKSFMDCVSTNDTSELKTYEIPKGTSSLSNFENSGFLTKLHNGRQHLTNVYPLTYRIEVLENIFSLLFATYEDLYSENTQHESDGLDTGDDETKSMNTSLTGSMESLGSIASTDVTNVDLTGPFSPFKEQDQAVCTPPVSSSTPESPLKVKGHKRHGSRGNKKQLFQSIRAETVPILATSNSNPAGTPGGLTEKVQQGTLVKKSIPKLELYDRGTQCNEEDCQAREEPKIGFIVNDDVVLEYLKTLKDCLMDVNAAKLLERQTGKSGIQNNPDWLYTSVASSTLEQRISRLGQYIVEAQWRHQLVSWTEHRQDERQERSSKGGQRLRQKPGRVIMEEEVKGPSEDDAADKNQTEGKSDALQGRASDISDPRSEESSSYQSQELTTGTEDNMRPSKIRKKRTKRLRHGRRYSVSEGLVIKDDSTVARMLSSSDTLIFMCLRKDSYDRAQQIIKMFQMHDKPSAQAAIFAEKFTNAFKELSKLQPRTRRNLSRRSSTSRTMGAVAMAAASGVTSSVVSNLIDELLTSPNLFEILLHNLDPADEAIQKSPLYRYVHPELIPAMVCLDLACTANVSWQVCKNLLDTAKSRHLQGESVSTKSEGCLVGVESVLADLFQLLLPATSDEQNTEATTIPLSAKPNLVDLLSGTQSLQLKSRNLSIKHEKDQQQSMKRMEQALEEGDTTVIAVQEAASKRSSPGRKSRDSRVSFSLVEKSLSVRVALAELLNSFNCAVVRSALGEGARKEERLDYLRSLVVHVDTLATLLLHWQTKPDDFQSLVASPKEIGRGVMMKATNPFVVLNKGIAETLGKPMFEKNVSPKRLEGVCKQLNINLVKVIVHNCCQHISSNGLTSTSASCWPSSKPVVLNDSSHWLDKAREPNVVAKELLTKMIDLLTDVAKKNDGLVDARGADLAVRSPQFDIIIQGIEELQRVDLDLLQTNDSKLCFFINVLNLLFAHSSLLQFSTSGDEDDWNPKVPLARHGSLTRLSSTLSGCSSSDDLGKLRGVSALDRISFLKHHCYTIGQIGPTSAFDILFMILRSGMFPPTMFGPAIQLCYPERPIDDPKRKYKPTHPDKRLIFAISDGCLSSPDLQVYDVKELDAQLNAAAMAYVNPHVTINAGSGQVVLPEILYWYRNDFNQGPFTDLEAMSNKTTQEPNVNFLLLLEPYLDNKKAAQLQSVLPSISLITYRPFCWKFGYRFDVSSLDHSVSSSSLPRSNSVPDSLHLSFELSGSPSTGSIESRGKFNPNQTTLEYLSKASPLVATLVELVCSTKSSTKSGNDNTEAVSLEKARCPMSKQSCFNYIIKRTAGFPALQRYFASRFYCIAEFLTMTSGETECSDSYELVRWEPKPLGEDNIESAPNILFFPLALSAEDSTELQYACQKSGDFFLRQGNFETILELMKTSSFHADGSCGNDMDYLLTSAILSKGGSSCIFPKRLDAFLGDLNLPSVGFSHKWHKKPWTLIAQIKDNDHLAQLVLSRLNEYKAKDGLDLLHLALSRPPTNTALRKELQYRDKELHLHVKISRCAKAPQLRTADDMDKPRSPSLLTQWQGVAATSVDDPNHVMDFLLSIQQYELAEDWAGLHALPSEYHKIIKESHLKHLLDSSPEDTMKAYRILEGIQEQHMALEVCQSLLQQNLHVSQTLFIIQYMLTNLQPHLSPLRIEQLLLTKMGAKALLCIPEMARSSYEHLVSRPHILLEQLLMNLKVEWAARVFSRLQVDLAVMGDDVDEGRKHHECTVKAFDDLLAKYAAKALQFQVVQAESSPEVTLSTTNGVLSSSPTPSATSFGGRISPSPSPGGQIPATKTSPEYSRGSLNRSISSIAGDSLQKSGQQSYLPPAIAPRKEEWMPDAQVLNCIICNEAFSMFNRRHHCRRCGRVVCGTCSRHNCVVQGYGKTPVRVCNSCYERYDDDKIHKESFGAAAQSSPSRSPAHQGASSLEKRMAREGVIGNYSTSPYATEVQAESQAANKWRLSLDPESIAALRDEFYYEQAPSSSLCIAILDLHSDNSVCGRLLLDLCNTLSKKLVPITPGVRNDEVDHNLIISMIRYLLFNAKLKMIKAGETHGLELCDTYLGHVDLMKFLAESNCGDIPSLQDLTHPDSARRLRDRFIEDERLTLAMEVSTKCGLESSSVWAAAGFACLHAGDLASAREKFAKCMKSSDGKPQQQQQHSQYLDKVMDILQTSPLISFSQSTDEILSPLRGLAEHCKSFAHLGSTLDNKRFDECLYYLHVYGSDASVVAFYGRHGHIRLACRYILDKKSHPDVFVESLLMRLISKGSVSALKEQLEAADPSLQSWTPYLTAACRYLHKRGYHHILYDLQMFMKDYFRAAQTCIRFFEGTPGGTVMSYEDLFSRLDYLSKARTHIEAVIVEKKSPRGSALSAGAWLRSHGNMRRKSTEEMQHVTITLSELTNHVNTINLQVEVTNFLHKCYLEGGNFTGLRARDDGKLPTLFGNGHVKAELAIQVLLSGSTIQDGVSLTARILQDYNLPASRVYVDAGRKLARQYRFNHIQQLLKCVGEMGLVSERCHDDIILACVRIVSTDQSQAKHVENLVKLLKSDSNKIDAFLLCGKLRSAYLIAVKERNVEAVQLIAEEAQKTGQTKTLNLCTKWLAQNQKVTETAEKVAAARGQSRR